MRCLFLPSCVLSAGLIIMEINCSDQVPEGHKGAGSIQPDLQHLIYCHCNIEHNVFTAQHRDSACCLFYY